MSSRQAQSPGLVQVIFQTQVDVRHAFGYTRCIDAVILLA